MKEFTLILTTRNLIKVQAESPEDALKNCWDALIAQGQIKATDPVSLDLVQEVD